MDCKLLLARLSDYIDQELDEDLTAEMRKHIENCPNCQVVVDTTEKMIVMCRDQGKLVIPADRRERLYTQLREAFLNRSPKTG